jgi:hypothetical protein
MPKTTKRQQAVACPCCGYPTLSRPAAFEICRLCDWEDDGQDDAAADEVWAGPNGGYSLAQARWNFRAYRVMYAPGRDQRIAAGDSELAYETKGALMAAYDRLRSAAPEAMPSIRAEVRRLNAILQADTKRRIRAYEASLRGDA